MSRQLTFQKETLKREAPEVFVFWSYQDGKTAQDLDHAFDHDWETLAGKSADFVDFPIWVVYLFVPLPVSICALHNHKMGFGCGKLARGQCPREHRCLYCQIILLGGDRVNQQALDHGMFLQKDPCLRRQRYEEEMRQLTVKYGAPEKDVTAAIQKCMRLPVWWRIKRPNIRADPNTRDQLQNSLAVRDAHFGDFLNNEMNPTRQSPKQKRKALAQKASASAAATSVGMADNASLNVENAPAAAGTSDVTVPDYYEESVASAAAPAASASSADMPDPDETEEEDVRDEDVPEDAEDDEQPMPYLVRRSEVVGDVFVYTNFNDQTRQVAGRSGNTFGVYRGIRKTAAGHEEEVIIKVWEHPKYKTQLADVDAIQNVIRTEVNALKRCSSDHVVQIIEYSQDPVKCPRGKDRFYFLVMEDGGDSLAHFCGDQGALTNEDNLHIVEQLFAAFGHIHQKGIMHRDVKPDNVVVRRRQGKLCVKLCDFGLAKVCSPKSTSSIGATTKDIGTHGWMAPEVMHLNLGKDRDDKRYSGAADVWGLGCVIFWLYNNYVAPFKDNQDVHDAVSEKKMDQVLQGTKGSFPVDHPRASALVQLMVVLDQKERVSLKNLRTHPYFWDFSTANRIVQTAWSIMDAKRDANAVSFRADFDKGSSVNFQQDTRKTWDNHIPKIYLTVLRKGYELKGDSGFELLAVFRHIINHRRDWPAVDVRDWRLGLENLLLKDFAVVVLQLWESSRKLAGSVTMSYQPERGILWDWQDP